MTVHPVAETAPKTAEQIGKRLEEMIGWPLDGAPVKSARTLAKSIAVAAQRRWTRNLSGYFDLGDRRFSESIQMMCAEFGLLHLLMDQMDRDPAKADELAAAICGMWDDGGEVGTTLWDHCQALGIDTDEVNRLEEAWQALPQPRQRPGDQAPPVPNDRPSLHDLAVDDIRRCVATSAEKQAAIALMMERKQIGYDRYASYLQAGNGRNAKRDLREELADAAVYALQVIEEDDSPEGIDDAYEDILGLLCRVAVAESGGS